MRPIALLVCAVSVATSAIALPWSRVTRSVLGSHVLDLVGRFVPSAPRGRDGVLTTSFTMFRDDTMPDGFVLAYADDISADKMLPYWSGARNDAIGMTLSMRRERSGLWAPTTEELVAQNYLVGTWMGAQDPWADAHLDTARDVFALELRAMGEPWASGVALWKLNPPVRTRTLWWGWLWNTGTILAFVAMLVSLSQQPATITRWWQRRRARRGLCPRCAFDRAGIDSNAPCPECGTIIMLPASAW